MVALGGYEVYLKKIALKHVRELRYLHFPPLVQCTVKGGKFHFCFNLDEISHACRLNHNKVTKNNLKIKCC